MSRAHKLRTCDKCGNDSEPLGGIEMRGKWMCHKCWTRYANRK